MFRRPPRSPPFPYTPLFRSEGRARLLQRTRGAREQGVGDVLLEARLHDEDTRTLEIARIAIGHVFGGGAARLGHDPISSVGVDRKSTRLNSSHSQISYAVFC